MAGLSLLAAFAMEWNSVEDDVVDEGDAVSTPAEVAGGQGDSSKPEL